jgi:hypothetical protein
MIELRDYQIEAVEKGREILSNHKLLIINYEVRLGKTLIALHIAERYKNVLFVTKKKAISSIDKDANAMDYKGNLKIINYEQLHKEAPEFDLVIFDESHSMAAFPKPSIRTKEAERICRIGCHVILMTGTLLPESNAQIFHQLYPSTVTPFPHDNFYKFHREFGTPAVKYTSYGTAQDYSKVDYDKIRPYIEPLLITYTQKQAGFKSEIKEHFLQCEMKASTYSVIERLKRDKVVEGKNGVVLADTAVKEMQKCHQLYSGTIKFENGSKMVFDDTKSRFIAETFKGKKMAIFYKFIAELEAIKMHLEITQDIEEFNTTDKHIALQIVSGREGINLSKANVLVYYNIDFSAVSYWQSRDRMTTIDRAVSNVYWIFSKGGIEWQIYKAVSNKKDFTLQTFKAWHQNIRPLL